MKNFMSKFMILAFALTSLTACQQGQYMREDGNIKKETMGTLAGAGLGAYLGSKVGGGSGRYVGTAVGTLLGAGLGASVGESLDKADMDYYHNSSQDTLETGTTGRSSTWRNPDTGNSGTITPTRTFEVSNGEYCREYTQTINVGGSTERAYGTACRQPDGSWQIVQ